MSRSVELYLRDILDAADAIGAFVGGLGPDDLRDDRKTRDAVVRNLEIIGEAVKRLPSALLDRWPQVDWAGWSRMRDVVAHQYFGVDVDVIWSAVADELPGLVAATRSLLEGAGQD
ncbi:DUF86 domain-containing protein [Acidobacteria bacterium ACD]|nr:MAG: DUF86 domain-containing protein [Acidobacteriota bacterium]MCE7958488.1 DUF86 domain-containing protein [Acidobacteria bacterium ACB2]MDL1950297.1 DUF86 domain-containing protein [Acidobacteria bacterium ACD]